MEVIHDGAPTAAISVTSCICVVKDVPKKTLVRYRCYVVWPWCHCIYASFNVIIYDSMYRTSPWLLAMTMVGLTQASHDLLREESFFNELFSDGCSVDCKNQQISR